MDCEQKEPTVDNSSQAKVDLKVCGVCGDKALGYNFNAVTCESCKAFFRRNALKNKEFRCPFGEKCEITLVTRRFCQRCRLVKCLDIGMRKDYIMTDEDKVIKKQKIEQNRAKKRPSAEHTSYKEEDECSHEMYENGTLRGLLEPNHKIWVGSSALEESYEEAEDVPANITPAPNSNTSHSHETADGFPSPAGAASVPSPSSPPDSATAACRTAEMVTRRTTRGATPVSVITPSILPSSMLAKPGVKSDTPLLASLITGLPNGTSTTQVPKLEALSPSRLSPPRVPNVMAASVESEEPPPAPSYYRSTKDAAHETLMDVQATNRRSPASSSSSAANSIESILSEAIKLEFEAYSSLAKTPHNSRELNDAERAKLNELIVANKALHDPLDHDLSTLVGDECNLFKTNVEQHPDLLDVINLTAIAIRRLIKTSKKINAFKNMCQEDQVALLKGGCTEMLILRSAMTYDPDKNSWNIPHTQERLNVKVDVLKEARGNIYEEHQRFLRTFELRWRTDENIMLILGAITLFTPDRPRVVHHDVIRLEQNAYYYLLRRYLESIYQGCEARSTFLKMIQKIAELHRLNDEHVKVYLDVNPRDVEPLLIEIFDLNAASLSLERPQ